MMRKIIGLSLIGIPLAVLFGTLVSVYGWVNTGGTLGIAILAAAMIIAGVEFLAD